MKGFVLYGGKKSVELGLFLEAARDLSVDIEVVDPRKIIFTVSDKEKKLFYEGKEIDVPDFAIAGFVNDFSYGNSAVMQQLENMGVFCINRADIANTTKDKLKTIQILAGEGVPTPKTMLVRFPFDYSVVEEEFGYPMVLKTLSGSGGSGVTLIHSRKELESVLTIARSGRINDELIIQEYIETSKGVDFRVLVMGTKAAACVIRKATKDNEFRSNVALGAVPSAHPLTDEIREVADKTAKVLGLFVGGIDLLKAEKGYVVCEANSIPGFYTPDFKEIYEMDVPKEFLRVVLNELHK